jgi:L-fuconolactonase
LVGVCHPIHEETDLEWLLRTDVQRGLEAVRDVGFVYDFHIRPRELPAALATAHAIPDMRFVVDHIAKPALLPARWRSGRHCWSHFVTCLT